MTRMFVNVIHRQRAVLYALVFALGIGIWWKTRVQIQPATPLILATGVLPSLSSAAASIHAVLERPLLAPAERDPFALEVSKPLQTPQAPVALAPPPALAVPMAPPLNLAFQGRVLSPAGQELIFAAMNESTVQLSVGQTLPNGYVVRVITVDAVELHYPPLNTRARLELPVAPRYEVR